MKKITDTRKGMEILVYLAKEESSYGHKISIDLKITYAHVSKILKFLKKKGFITTEKNGRIVYVTITEEGKNTAININKLDF